MSDGLTKSFFITAAVGAAIFAVVDWFVTNHLPQGQQFNNGSSSQPDSGGIFYQNMNTSAALNLDPQQGVYFSPGGQGSRGTNGAVFVKKFNKGGNHNSMVGHEQSYAIQTSTKNPFANGTNNSYANAVNTAAQDPTNQATALIVQ